MDIHVMKGERERQTRVLDAGVSGNDGREGMEGKSAMRSLSLPIAKGT